MANETCPACGCGLVVAVTYDASHIISEEISRLRLGVLTNVVFDIIGGQRVRGTTTHADISGMSAPEIGALIAERVMGWRKVTQMDDCACWDAGESVRRYTGPTDNDGQFDPLTNIAHAWEVVEKMSYWNITVQHDARQGHWWCRIEGERVCAADVDVTVTAKTAPLAICLAALRASSA